MFKPFIPFLSLMFLFSCTENSSDHKKHENNFELKVDCDSADTTIQIHTKDGVNVKTEGEGEADIHIGTDGIRVKSTGGKEEANIHIDSSELTIQGKKSESADIHLSKKGIHIRTSNGEKVHVRFDQHSK